MQDKEEAFKNSKARLGDLISGKTMKNNKSQHFELSKLVEKTKRSCKDELSGANPRMQRAYFDELYTKHQSKEDVEVSVGEFDISAFGRGTDGLEYTKTGKSNKGKNIKKNIDKSKRKGGKEREEPITLGNTDKRKKGNRINMKRRHKEESFSKKQTEAQELIKEDQISSSGDERLSRAFNIDKSLTMTPKLSSHNISHSKDLTDPDLERSMLTEELRTLSLLNEDDKDDEFINNSMRLKNRLQKKSMKFNTQRKYTLNDSSKHSSEIIKPRKKETCMFSTMDSKKKLNNSLNNKNGNSYLKDLRNSDLSKPRLSEIEEYKYDSSQFNDKETPKYVPNSINYPVFYQNSNDPNDYETQNMYYRPYPSDINLHLLKGVNFSQTSSNFYNHKKYSHHKSENLNNNKGKRQNHKVENASEFDIIIDDIFNTNKTTLMIRNIPNKYTKELMLKTIDRYFKHTYDFFYLPIDFKNNCNVGYAFINFKKIETIEAFYNRFNKQRWEMFNSDKVCQIKYARIQGKKECKEHFKDSSLMKQPVS